jgi:hypothetical protein
MSSLCYFPFSLLFHLLLLKKNLHYRAQYYAVKFVKQFTKRLPINLLLAMAALVERYPFTLMLQYIHYVQENLLHKIRSKIHLGCSPYSNRMQRHLVFLGFHFLNILLFAYRYQIGL